MKVLHIVYFKKKNKLHDFLNVEEIADTNITSKTARTPFDLVLVEKTCFQRLTHDSVLILELPQAACVMID